MTKVLFLINTLGSGGAESVLVETANSLDRKKYDVTVQTITDTGVNKNKLASHIRYKTVIRCRNPMLRYIWTRVVMRLFGAKYIYRFFVQDNYDYEIAFLEGWPTKVISHSTNKNAKKYAWVHTDLTAFPDSYRAYGSEQKEGEAYRRFDRIFCVSECARSELQKKYRLDENKLRVVYNILDDQAIRNAAKEENPLPLVTRPLLISVGRLIPQKGYERLLRVHHRLIKEGLQHTLVILGDGPQKEALSDYIHQNSLSATALLMGYQPTPHKYVSRADLFVCSSMAEGYSMVISEAVLCGTPVISTDVTGVREPLDCPRCSIIVENSEDALYNGIKKVLENPGILKSYQAELSKIQAYLKKDFLLSEFERKVFGDNLL